MGQSISFVVTLLVGIVLSVPLVVDLVTPYLKSYHQLEIESERLLASLHHITTQLNHESDHSKSLQRQVTELELELTESSTIIKEMNERRKSTRKRFEFEMEQLELKLATKRESIEHQRLEQFDLQTQFDQLQHAHDYWRITSEALQVSKELVETDRDRVKSECILVDAGSGYCPYQLAMSHYVTLSGGQPDCNSAISRWIQAFQATITAIPNTGSNQWIRSFMDSIRTLPVTICSPVESYHSCSAFASIIEQTFNKQFSILIQNSIVCETLAEELGKVGWVVRRWNA